MCIICTARIHITGKLLRRAQALYNLFNAIHVLIMEEFRIRNGIKDPQRNFITACVASTVGLESWGWPRKVAITELELESQSWSCIIRVAKLEPLSWSQGALVADLNFLLCIFHS